ncbi:MAG: transcriptional repressor LexA [Candidatus Paceibacterota bacterium]
MALQTILTTKQKETLEFLEASIRKNGFSPLITEIKEHFKLKSLRSVTQRLDALEKKGLIRRDSFKHRGITVVNHDIFSKNQFLKIPVIASVGCDAMSVYAQEQFGEYLTVAPSLVGSNKEVVAVKAIGNSMIDAGIYNGDYVLVEKTEFVGNGDRVVAIIGDMAVLKRLQTTQGLAILHPEAKGYQPIVLDETSRIFGKFIRTIPTGRPEDDIEYVHNL